MSENIALAIFLTVLCLCVTTCGVHDRQVKHQEIMARMGFEARLK